MKARNLRLLKGGHPASCKHCCFRPRVKFLGDIYVVTTKPEKSVDGSDAYEMIWVCRRGGHLKKIGFTRPVDFAKQ